MANSTGKSLRNQIIVTIAAVCFLTFVWGAYVAEFHVFPYRLMFRNPFAYVHAWAQRKGTLDSTSAESHTVSATGQVTIPAGPEAFDGYTLLSFGTARPSTARLIDMQGHVVHEWHKPSSEIWPNHPQREKAWPDYAMSFRHSQLFPNGDLLTVVTVSGDTPWGYGLVKLDKDSKVIWSIADNFHHQFSIGSDGRIYSLVHYWRDTKERPIPGCPFMPKLVLEDFVVVLSPEGKELSRFSLLDAMAAPGFRELLASEIFKSYESEDWDPLHANDVKIIEPEFAAHHSFMKPGMVVVSLRDLDALIVLDLTTGSVQWAKRGAWLRQHDPELLSNGDVMLLDNLGNRGGSGESRILQVNLESNRTTWSYAGTADHPFESHHAGGLERLPNGNTLIFEDRAGRAFEVTPDDKIVWEYHDAQLHHATRIAKDWLKFVPTLPHGLTNAIKPTKDDRGGDR